MQQEGQVTKVAFRLMLMLLLVHVGFVDYKQHVACMLHVGVKTPYHVFNLLNNMSTQKPKGTQAKYAEQFERPK